MNPNPQDVSDTLAQLQLWQLLATAAGFAGAGALLKVMVERVRAEFWKVAVRVLSSAFWGAMAAILLSDWLRLTPKSLLVFATLLGWLGFEVTLSNLLKSVSKKTDFKLEEKPKPARKRSSAKAKP